MSAGRFAPSATGAAHPGTLLAALLAWLDARSRGARFVLRIEDLDPERCTPELTHGLIEACRWLGIDWDALEIQSQQGARHAAALDRLAELGVLYPCDLSRSQLAALGRRAPDGSWACDNRNRCRPLPPGGWRSCDLPLRVALPAGVVVPGRATGDAETRRCTEDRPGTSSASLRASASPVPVCAPDNDLAMDPSLVFGDPVVRRRDGAVAYQLAVVVDDAAQGVDRVVRGRDIAPSTAVQVALQRLLGLPEPAYRHHLLLLEPAGGKLAKLHRSVGLPALVAAGWDAPRLCGFLAHAAGLRPDDRPVNPAELSSDFTWDRVVATDRTVHWDGRRLGLD